MAAAGPVEFGIYLPQVGFSYAELRERALTIEELGFHSLWLMDHLYPPELPGVGSLEAWTTATALLSHTTRLRVGHLVLASTLRHPALLGKMITSLDSISNGRLEIGIGSGSYAAEHERAGIPWGSTRERATLLAETLEIVTRMLHGEEASFAGERFEIRDLPNRPGPVQRPHPPIHVGGAGERLTLPLVARYADVWNCPTYALADLTQKRDRLAAECARIGRDVRAIRISLEAVLALAAEKSELAQVQALAQRRFGGAGWGLEAGGFVGTPDRIVARIRALVDAGVTFFVFFTHDRAERKTLELFAREVMPLFRA